jgi:potassium-dependent mechanosensitive channel
MASDGVKRIEPWALAGIARLLPFAIALLLSSALVSPAAPEATAVSDHGSLIAQVRERMAMMQAELGDLGSGRGISTNLLAGATPSETREYELILHSTLRAYQRYLNVLLGLEALNQRQRDLLETARSWTGFSEPPPYSILLIDNLRDTIQTLEDTTTATESTRDILQKIGDESRENLKRSDSRLRALNEALETASDPGEATVLTWKRTMELARNRLAAANAGVFDHRRKAISIELAEHRQRAAFIRRQLAVASRQVRFSQADLDKVLGGLNSDLRKLEAERDAAELAGKTARTSLETAREELQQALTASRTGGATDTSQNGRVHDLQMLVDTRSIQVETADLRVTLVHQMFDVLIYERAMWESRFESFGSTNPSTLQDAYRRLTAMQRLLKTVKPYFIQQTELAARRLSEERERISETGQAPQLAEERLSSIKDRETAFMEALRRVERTDRLLLRWKESLDQDRTSLPFTGRVRDLFSEFSTFASKLWNFELLVAEDTITVDGQSITGRRSVTVSKTIKAIVILAIGYWVAHLFAALIERMAVRRFRVGVNQARLVRRWIRAFLVLILVIASLAWVKIPLTIFAFMGGALAIGLGFGMQTMLKNLISGIIILFERPFRVGDVLLIENQRGTVTSIGIRSCVVHMVNGTELLIPNSVLLENNLTNWTYSSKIIRSRITVVVLCESDTRKVTQLIADSVERHGLVLKEPAPKIRFANFAADGFEFELLYWVDLGKADWEDVASDLRHMIAHAFAENDITISYPQQDTHLDTKVPLKVEVTRKEPRLTPRAEGL